MTTGEVNLIPEEAARYALDDLALKFPVLIAASPGEHDIRVRRRRFAQDPPHDQPLDEQEKSATDPHR